jgi:hypothetical protein
MENLKNQDDDLIILEDLINTSPLLTIMPKSVIVETEKNNERELLKQKINTSPVLIMTKSRLKELIQKLTEKKSNHASLIDNQAEIETDKEELSLLKKFFDNVCLYAIKYFKGDEYQGVAYEVAIASIKGFRFTKFFVDHLEKNGTNLEKNISNDLENYSIQRENDLYKEFLKNICNYVVLLGKKNKLSHEYSIEQIEYTIKDTLASYNFITYFFTAYKTEYLKILHKDAIIKRRHQSITSQDQSNESIFTDENELCSNKKAHKSPLSSIENDEIIEQYLDLIEDVFETFNDNQQHILKKIKTSELSLIMTNDEKLSEHLEYFKSKAYFDAELYAYCIEKEKELNKAEIARKIMGIQSDKDLKTERDRKRYNNLQMEISRLNFNFISRLSLKLKDEIILTLEKKKRRERPKLKEDKEDKALKLEEDKEDK